MKITIKFFVFLTLFFMILSSFALFAKVKNENVTIAVDWRIIMAEGLWNELYNAKKISESTEVSLEVLNFNFLRYNLDHEIKEEVIESYRVLENLWSQVFTGIAGIRGVISSAKKEDIQDEFLECLMKWQNELITGENELQDYLDEFTREIKVSDDDIASVEVQIKEFKAAVKELHCLKNKTKNKIYTSKNTSLSRIYPFKLKSKDEVVAESKKKILMTTDTVHSAVDAYYATILYKSQLEDHEKIMDKFNAFFTRAELILAGKRIALGKKEPGTMVTVTLTPTKARGTLDSFKLVSSRKRTEDQKSASAPTSVIRRYFVQSDMPIVFHIGYSVSTLNNAEFEKIKTLTGNEVYNQITGEGFTQNLAAFLSYELWASNNLAQSLAFTIGTEMASPGKKIYLGGSIQFLRRWFFTAALATGEITEGVKEISGDSEMQLFHTIKNTRKWEAVFAISIRLF